MSVICPRAANIVSANIAPPDEIVHSCAEYHLRNEIMQIQPSVIVTMGAVSSKLIDPNMEINVHHGIPFWGTILGYKCWILPTYHPALGIHMPEMIWHLRRDFQVLRQLLNGRYVDRKPPSNPLKVHLETPDDVEMLMMGAGDDLAIDTETVPGGGLWCMTLCASPETVFLAKSKKVYVALNRYMHKFKNYILHNSPFDYPILTEQGGLRLPWGKVRDTMLMTYLRGPMGQGLKSLAFRLLRMRMKEFEEVVVEPAKKQAIEYIREVAGYDFGKPEPVLIDKPDGSVQLYKPKGIGSKIKTLVTAIRKTPEIKIFKRWENWSKEERMLVTNIFGPFPEPDISTIPFEKAFDYATDDALATLLLKQELDKIKYRRPR